MKDLPKLEELSIDDKDALIIELWQEIQNLRRQIAGQKKVTKKTEKNSSIPPSKGFKDNIKPSEIEKKKRAGHKKGGRELDNEPNQIIIAQAKVCPNCHQQVETETQELQAVYEKIEVPKIKPLVTQIRQHGGECPHCQQKYLAPVPVGMEPGSPFGKSIEQIATYCRYSHAISYQRLSKMMSEMFQVKISEGGLSNLFQRVKSRLDPQVQAILERLQQSRIVCSDETSARVNGKTEWEWVFQNEEVCLHVIRPSRGTKVIEEVMENHRPEIWVSDLFSAQKNHPATEWQVCLAHQLRDCQYAIDAGDQIFAPRMKQVLLRAFVIHKRRSHLADSTLYQYRCDLNRRLNLTLNLEPEQKDGIRLRKRYQKIKDHLFLFLDDASIPPTNNSSEQALRMSVIFRKVTNCFRSEWGRDLFAHVRSVVNTGMRQGLSAFQAIENSLSPLPSLFEPS